MAYHIACSIPPEWIKPESVVCFIPGSSRAIQKRGFDHAQELANEVARLLGIPVLNILAIQKARDQRGLGRHLRAQNVKGRFSVCRENMPAYIILVDDVYTTGSTVMAASDALKDAGAPRVYAATFARV